MYIRHPIKIRQVRHLVSTRLLLLHLPISTQILLNLPIPQHSKRLVQAQTHCSICHLALLRHIPNQRIIKTARNFHAMRVRNLPERANDVPKASQLESANEMDTLVRE